MSTTRISDLPENITVSMQPINGYQNPQQMTSMDTRRPHSEDMNLTYTQMNVHPNPYGNPEQPQMIPLPQVHQPQYRLPSRDIPMDTETYMQDLAITPNYIPPPPKLTSDYIRDYEFDEEVEIKNHKNKKQKRKINGYFDDGITNTYFYCNSIFHFSITHYQYNDIQTIFVFIYLQ